MLLCGGLVPYFNAALPKSVLASPWMSWICYVPLACMAFAPYAVPKIIKRLITWPRIGYVATPGELKLTQLLLLMLFGGALGLCIGSLLILAVQTLEYMGGAGSFESRMVFHHAVIIAVCIPLVIFLWPKVITKPKPFPTAYDASVICQMPLGKQTMKTVKFILIFQFIATPALLGALVFWLACASKSVLHRVELHWPQLMALSIIVVANAALFLMGNAVVLKQYKWKRAFPLLLVLAPFAVAFTLPYAASQSQPMLELFPPPVMLCTGFIWFASGALTLLAFVHHNPLPSAEPA